MNAEEAVAYVDHFQRRVLQDALAEATPAYWRRRAETFARLGTPACYEIAAACMNAASLWEENLDGVVCPTCGTRTSPWTCSCGHTKVGGPDDLD